MAAADEAIVNRTRGSVLHPSPAWALTAWRQTIGLMGTRPVDRAMVFLFLPARHVRLHMWFVFAPIDVLVLDGRGVVIAVKERFMPWTYWDAGVTGSAVVELPAGTLRRTQTRIGDRIALPRPPRRADTR